MLDRNLSEMSLGNAAHEGDPDLGKLDRDSARLELKTNVAPEIQDLYNSVRGHISTYDSLPAGVTYNPQTEELKLTVPGSGLADDGYYKIKLDGDHYDLSYVPPQHGSEVGSYSYSISADGQVQSANWDFTQLSLSAAQERLENFNDALTEALEESLW